MVSATTPYMTLDSTSWLQLEQNVKFQSQLAPHERVFKVKAFWEGLNDEERAELLSVVLAELRLRAAELDGASESAG